MWIFSSKLLPLVVTLNSILSSRCLTSCNPRVAACDMLKQSLIAAVDWFHANEHTYYRDICLSLLWEIDKIQLTDGIPCFDSFQNMTNIAQH